MPRPIEDVVAEAHERLEQLGRLNVEAYATAYPEFAAELRRILPTLVTVFDETRLAAVEERTRAFAVNLFKQAAEQVEPAPEPVTVGALIQDELQRTGRTIADYAAQTRLPEQAVHAMRQDTTLLQDLNAGPAIVKLLAQRWSAPFATVMVELRRLISLQQANDARPRMLFTRNKETSSGDEHKALMEKVFESTDRKRAPDGRPENP